jgi:4'-phosphopantetheinyl transferase
MRNGEVVISGSPAVDLWLEPLDGVGGNALRAYEALLDSCERAKAQRFLSQTDRRRYVVGHGKLRRILATYLPLQPEAITLAARIHGKPFIAGDGRHGIKFNLAHSGGYLLVAVNHGNEIGVDIEQWTDKVDYDAVLALCFSASERRVYRALPEERKKKFFYRLWTRKESFVKAVGEGLRLDVTQVVSSSSGPARFVALPAGYGGPERWGLLDLELGRGLSGALSFPGEFPPHINFKRLG